MTRPSHPDPERDARTSSHDLGVSPRFAAADLRSAATPAAVERVWSRLEDGLQTRPSGGGYRVGFALVVSAATFVLGFWAGAEFREPEMASLVPSSEPHTSPAGPTLDVAMDPAVTAVVSAQPGRAVGIRPVPSGLRQDARRRGSLAPHLDVPEPNPKDGVAGLGAELETGPRPSAAESSAPPPWQRLANGGEYEAALFELAQQGGFEIALTQSSAEQLMLLSDIARATGQHQRGVAALRRLLDEFPADPIAPLAAWSLGNLLEKLGDVEGARAAFSLYRALSPAGEFAEDALVRQLKTAVSLGDRDVAMRLVQQYESDFPEGRRSAEVVRLASRLSGLAAQTDAGLEADDVDESP